jgi:hypothetical protein
VPKAHLVDANGKTGVTRSAADISVRWYAARWEIDVAEVG